MVTPESILFSWFKKIEMHFLFKLIIYSPINTLNFVKLPHIELKILLDIKMEKM